LEQLARTRWIGPRRARLRPAKHSWLRRHALGPQRERHAGTQLGVADLVGDHAREHTEQLELDARAGQHLRELTKLLDRAMLVAGAAGPLDRRGATLLDRPRRGIEAVERRPWIAMDLLAMRPAEPLAGG